MNGNNLQLFWEIASSNQDARLTSANQLVEELLSQQDVLASSSKITLDLPSTTESTDDDDQDMDDPLTVDEQEAESVEEALGNRTVADLMYALRRLLRGLASPRESSRLGFAVVLTELLSRIRYAVSAKEILTLVLKYSNPQVAASRQEQKDFMFAKLFGIMSLVQSELLVQPSATISDFKRSMSILIALSSDKPWMAESCAWVMVQAVAQLQRADVEIEWSQAAQSWMTEQISSTKELSPEKLAVMLQLSHGAGADFFQTVALPSMRKEHPLSTANLASLARVLKEAIPSENEATATAGARSRWQAKIHFVWDLILDVFFDSTSSAETRIASFPDFYRVVVDETLFAAASSHDRKSWGFQVFQRALPRANDTDKPMLFTPNFMRTLINQLGNRDRLLHRAAVKATETIQDVVKQQPHLGFVLVTQLIGKNGHQNFDSITKTKTVEQVLSSLDIDRVREYVKHLGEIICQGIDTEDEDELTEINNRRKWALDQLLFLVRTPTVPKDDQLLVDVLTFLAAHGYYTMQKPLKKRFLLERLPTPAFTDSLKQVTRSRFLSSVSELAKQAPPTGASVAGKKTPGVAQDGQLWLAKAHDVLLQLEKDKSFKSIFDHDDEIAAKLADGVRCLDKVRKFEAKSTDADVKERARAFQSLLLSALLVSADAADGASDLVEPLCACADKLFPAPSAASSRKGKQVEDQSEVTGVELLCDCLLSFLELSSAFLRTSATNAFEAFTQDMTKGSIGLLLSHLRTADEVAQDADEDEDEDMDDEEASDEVEEDGKPRASDTSATSDDDDESDADADQEDEDDEDQEVDEELRARVRAVLKESGMADPDDAAQDGEDDEDEAEDAQSDAGSESSVEFSDLGDDEMMLLDDKLAEVFRQRVSASRGQKEAKQEAIALRFKVLELVEVFARKQPQSPLMLDLIEPLYDLWSNRDEDTEQLATKARTLLLSRISKAKTVPDDFDADHVATLLQRMHTEARESQSNDVSNVSQAINLYLTKVALSKSGDDVKAALGGKLVEIYRESLLDYLMRKSSRLRHEFLIDAFRRFPMLGWELRSELLDNCRPGAATRAFRQVQVMSMLQAVLTQIAQRPEKGEVLGFVPEISSCFVQIITDSCDAASTSALSSNHMKDTIKFVLQAARISSRIEPGANDKLQGAWKVVKLQDAADKLQSSERFKASTSIHDLMKQLIKVLQPDATGADGKKKKNNKDGGKNDKKRAAEESTPIKVNGKSPSPAKKVKATSK
ncbi:DNA polymerase V [Kalmanozyma brasiliensis GHG001]|uniref:DNA polymerase V n=1 Tax=Kalmanozyma brasiliensis (strain GHG001) TaxID=1365824 RepID=V5F327_KALBG|nr:DNA polymerase V [Kalmanozyma brasiliensis GHG001]EST09894.1 DNA polymerase V [Kalmanozyma brasiliensis GHG001]